MSTHDKDARCRAWCFTINNYKDVHIQQLKDIKTKYLVYGLEVGKSGTPHIQGYMELASAQTMSALKKKLPGAHLEPRKATPEQAAAYCKKDGEFTETGTISQQGKRNDIQEVCSAIKEGKSFEDILDSATSYQSLQVAKVAMPYKEPVRDWIPQVFWYWGPPGTGKSHTAFHSHPDARIHKQAGSTKWWQGYDRHDVVLIDDLRQRHIDFVRLLELLDRYPTTVENKGGSRQFVPHYIYITSPYPPDIMFRDEGENIDQLIRRITEVVHFEKKYVAPLISKSDSDEASSEASVQGQPSEQGPHCDEELCQEDDA